MTRLELCLKQIDDTRQYTKMLLAKIDDKDWYTIPTGHATNVAWQVGHLIMAEYRLTIARVFGTSPEHEQWYPTPYLTRFGKGSEASSDPAQNPSIEELKTTLDRIHPIILGELKDVSDEDLDSEVVIAHPLYKTKLESLLMCARHEMLHAGQIGSLRRGLGYAPAW